MMTADQIMDEVRAVETLAAGETLDYDSESDSVVVGQDGCQTGGTCCLRVGPDHIAELDLREIRTAVVACLTYWRQS